MAIADSDYIYLLTGDNDRLVSLGSYSSCRKSVKLDDCGLCIQMRANLEKLYYILNKSQSRIIVEVDLTTASYSKRQIEFKHGDIRQFLVLSDNIYSINCKGILQIFNFKSSSFKEATITASGSFPMTTDSMIVDNFTVSSDEKFIAITGCEMKKNHVYKNVIHVYQVNKMKKISSTVLKVQGT